jgi:hypothetical protein
VWDSLCGTREAIFRPVSSNKPLSGMYHYAAEGDTVGLHHGLLDDGIGLRGALVLRDEDIGFRPVEAVDGIRTDNQEAFEAFQSHRPVFQ